MKRLISNIVLFGAVTLSTVFVVPEVLAQNHLVNVLQGRWSYTPAAGTCASSYEFRADGTFSEASARETSTGTYQVSNTISPGGFYRTTVTTTGTNGARDCAGQTSTIGEVEHLFAQFSSGGSVMYLCQAEAGPCMGPVKRLTPST